MPKVRRIALRIDDIGASTKVHERYARRRLLNVGILRDRRLFGAWGPYREMEASEWKQVLALLARRDARLTVAVTASWVEADGSLTPFPRKFPKQAAVLRKGMRDGLLEIANHGLTHCVLKDRLFLPRLWGSNRRYHREFWDWLPAEEHEEHLRRSQEILRDWFDGDVRTLVPPGNVFSSATVRACRGNGIRVLNCQAPKAKSVPGLRIVGNEETIAFHDRELVLDGIAWLESRLDAQPKGTRYCFVRDL